ncbi:hypothetical protein [Deinococcus hopiensis]|uniref:Uncharacterized protein n=1 Tax=Deinococcus hopiensis KR-140 TaxID=695939 RepID=A0A1W1V7E2_9DEIO|nr:hypothetical protein [Deinococcus hopiensis]SMB89120.1 hypothetical protein SAMN00790413_00277 [Deinococcus hopiensis KR-140]
MTSRPPLRSYPSRLAWAADLFARMHASRLEREANATPITQPAPQVREEQAEAKRPA